MVLSLSPGPPPQEYVDFMAKYAQPWPGKSGYPIGTAGGLRPVCEVAAVCEAGQLVEGDLLPSGFLGPDPGWGEPRHSRETKDEQRTEFTLCDDREGAANTRGKSDKTPCVYAIIDDEQGSYRDQPEGVGKVIQKRMICRPASNMLASGRHRRIQMTNLVHTSRSSISTTSR
jgi:hypothetical protein